MRETETQDIQSRTILVFDDREHTSGDVQNIVGIRRFGDIIFKRRSMFEHVRSALPAWAYKLIVRIQSSDDLVALRLTLELCGDDATVCVIASRAGFKRPDLLYQFIERLPYARENFADKLFKPLIVFFSDVNILLTNWREFIERPLHKWERSWHSSQRLNSLKPLDLGVIGDFLALTSDSTSARYFNEVSIDEYFYTKRSIDKFKIQAEYSFYGLVPEQMRPWLIETFDFKDEGDQASYKMLRYYLADAALQWVHGAFTADTFVPFCERLLKFISDRPQQDCSELRCAEIAEELFVTKPKSRIENFLAMAVGQRVNQLASATSLDLELSNLLDRYLKLLKRLKKGFTSKQLAIGHGDPCLSNILYDQQRHLLKLIDPKGALSKEDLWTHPLYDLCKVSHSILGDYDFINHCQYTIAFTDNNNLQLIFPQNNHLALKDIFTHSVKSLGYDIRIIRLGEVSLFLSMLPFHIDYPNKIMAFILKAKQILDYVEEATDS